MDMSTYLPMVLCLINGWICSALRCKMCALREGLDQAVTSDNLRILTDLRRPNCFAGHEEVECHGYQDACIKLVVQMLDDGNYWLAKGCSRKMPFVPNGCHEVHTETKEEEVGTIKRPGFMRTLSGTAIQHVCTCSTDNCNPSRRIATNAFLLSTLVTIVIIFQPIIR